MKVILFLIGVFIAEFLYAQPDPGFNKKEARDMIALCNSFTFLDLYNTDTMIVPAEYKKIYTSGVFGMDNKYQLYTKGNTAVICFRGSTDKQISWVENIYSSMIPANGVMTISGEKFEYSFAKDSNAAVHAGYALGIAFLHNEILYQVNTLNRQGIFKIIITGHSQGGALANMLRAYLENTEHGEIDVRNKFTTYAFAAPMSGNKFFTREYNERYAKNGSSFNIINHADPIPDFPLSYNDTAKLADNLKTLLYNKDSFNLGRIALDKGTFYLKNNINQLLSLVGTSAAKKISKEIGDVAMPRYTKDINYFRVANVIEISGSDYPKILKDSSILQNDSLMAIYSKDIEGNFTDEKLYAKEPWAYQHKPYNYYVSFLKIYYPEEYKLLKKKYLLENL